MMLGLPTARPKKPVDHGVPIDSDFPEGVASELAKLESYNKHLYRPNTYLHKWWARRPGTTFRHILKMLVSDPAKRDFYAPGGLEGKVIYDPMMGGGTTLHEAIRLGANVIGVDIDPIPALQAKATLGPSSVSHRRVIFRHFLDCLRTEISMFFKTSCPICGAEAEIQFILYGLRRQCECREVLVIDDVLLRQQKGGDVRICPLCHDVFTGQRHSCNSAEAGIPLERKNSKGCPLCGSQYRDILTEPFADRYVPLVVNGTCRNKHRFFKRIDEHDLSVIGRARLESEQIAMPTSERFRVPSGPKSIDLKRKGIADYLELFTARQILYLDKCRRLLEEVPGEDKLWLALLVSTSLEFNCLLCGYKGGDIRRPGAIRHVFSHHAYSFPYTALENNPAFPEGTSGTLVRLFRDRIERAALWASRPTETQLGEKRGARVSISGETDSATLVSEFDEVFTGCSRCLVLQADSSRLEVPADSVDYVVTDPPYHDNVQYSDLSGFFRAWLSVLLPHEADWSYDSLRSAVSEGGDLGARKYEDTLARIWSLCHKALKKKDARLVFTFHHWSPDAWSALTISLRRARFVLVSRYIVRSESSISVHVRDLRALKHDSILVLRPVTGPGQSLSWPKPGRISSEDSSAFCGECSAALGWFLSSDLDDDSVRAAWRDILKRTECEKAPS